MKKFGKFCNPKEELNKIEKRSKDYDIIVEEPKDDKRLNVYYRELSNGAMFPVLRCIGKYTNYSRKTKKAILDKATEVKYVR